MNNDQISVFLFAEQCVRAGQVVPEPRDGVLDDSSPDYWHWYGTREELRDQAMAILNNATESVYRCRCAESVLDAIGYDRVWRIRILPGLDVSGQFLEDWDEDGEPTWTADEAKAYRFSTAKESDDYEYPNTIAEPFAVPRY